MTAATATEASSEPAMPISNPLGSGLSFSRIVPPPLGRQPSRLDLVSTLDLLSRPDVLIYGKPVKPNLDLGVKDLWNAGLLSLKGIRRARQPIPMQPNRAEITSSRERLVISLGTLEFLGGADAVVLVGSMATDMIFVGIPQRTALRVASCETRESRAYLRLQSFGAMTAGLVPGGHEVKYGFMGPRLPAIRLQGALAVPPPEVDLLQGVIWQPGINVLQNASQVAPLTWRPAHSWEIRTYCIDSAVYAGGVEPAVASMASPWRPRSQAFVMAELHPSGIRLHADVDAELGHSPGFALCAERDWPTSGKPSDLVMVASANPEVAFSVDRTGKRVPGALIRLDGRLAWLQHCLRYGPRNGDINCNDGLLSLRLSTVLRPREVLEEPYRVSFPGGAPNWVPESVRFANGTRDPFYVRGEESKT